MVKIFQAVKNIGRFLATCKIFVGKLSSSVTAPALIFFPLTISRFNCGFAGLMTFKITDKKSDIFNSDVVLTQLCEKVEGYGLHNILSGKITAKEYLHGQQTLISMEEIVSELKEENRQEILFFQAERTKKLENILRKMNLFLEGEEKILEDNAASLTSADLEIINSRIILFKDILWSLGKDILDNFAKIIDLAGAQKTESINRPAFKKYRQLNL
ncbi:MAG: hypothetical protein ABFD76_05680, partial [Smithella sp.]